MSLPSAGRAAPEPLALFDTLLRRAASTPFVTYYNELTGERAELSAKSLGNWVAKTHFLFLDGLGLGPGDRAEIHVAADWLAPAILLGAWSAGLGVIDGTADGHSDVAIVDAGTAALVTGAVTGAGAIERYAVNPASLSRSWGASPPDGTEDFVTAVRPQPDAWAGVRPAIEERRVVDDLLVADALAMAADWVAVHEVTPAERLLFAVAPPISTATPTAAYPRAQDWIPLLIAPLLVGGSVVYVAGTAGPHDPDTTLLHRRAEQERARLILWP